MLGIREVGHYGTSTLDDINTEVSAAAKDAGVEVDFLQSNSEGEIVTYIQSRRNKSDGIIINPGAYTHTSVAIRDALLAASIPFVEIHLSNIHAREEFRKKSYLSDKAVGVISGFGKLGYIFALKGILEHLNSLNTKVC
jgi:3-dehydroquinate dehydratase-2